MHNYERKRIPIEYLEEGMRIGEDVVDSNGTVLIQNNTVINEKHLFHLKLYQILSVVIQDIPETITNDIPKHSDAQLHDNEHSFQAFRSQYSIVEADVRKELHHISSGNPIDMPLLLSKSTSLLNSLRTKSDLFDHLIHLRSNDDYTYTHSLNVSLLCNIFGHWLKWPQEQIDNLTVAGLLHDIGKVKIDTSLLNKPGKLTEEEFKVIKKHTLLGYELVKYQDIPEDIKYGILMHHEKMDGTGYPLGLTDVRIHDFAKIIAIADIYDAMTSNRSYHKKFSPFKVIQVFEQDSFGLLDTTFLFVFLENIAHNYLGKTVLLSNGEEAKIVFIHNQSPSRPIVQIGEVMLDLLTNPSITIEEIL